MSHRPMIGLRHDVDTGYDFTHGIEPVSRLEDRNDARSTFFVRVRLLKGHPDRVRILERLQDDGWEIGLHLDNTVASPKEPSPQEELEELTLLGFRVHGVTPHGGLYGFKGRVTWEVMDSLGLDYMMGYPPFPKHHRTPIIGPHHTIDFLVKERGARKGVDVLLQRLDSDIVERGYGVVLMHPLYMKFSVGPSLTFSAVKVSRRQGWRAYVLKQVDRGFKALYTLLGLRRVGEAYTVFLKEARDRGWELVSIHDVLNTR